MDMSSKSHSTIWLFSGLPLLATAIVAAALVAFGPWWQGHRLEAAYRTGMMSDARRPTGNGVDSSAHQTKTTENTDEELILLDLSKWELRSWRPESGAIVAKKLPLGGVFSGLVRGAAVSPDGRWLAFISKSTPFSAVPPWLWFLDLESSSTTLAAAWISPDEDSDDSVSWLSNSAAVLVNQLRLTPKQKALFTSGASDMAIVGGDGALDRFESEMLSLGPWEPTLALVAVPPGVSTKRLECDLNNDDGSPVAVWRNKVAYIRGDSTDIAVNPTPTTLCCYDMQTRENVSLMRIGHQSAPLCWSRDGRKLLFGVWEFVEAEYRRWLMLCDLSGKCTRLDTLSHRTPGAYCWLGNSQTVIYIKDGRILFVASAAGDVLFETSIKLPPEQNIANVSSSSDGRYFAFGTGDRVCIYGWSGGQAQLVDTIQGSYTFRWCKVTPPTPSLLGTEHAGVRDREARVLINKYPALAAWFGFYNAMKADDIDTAWQFLCDDTGGSFQRLPSTSEMNVDFAAEMIQDLYKSYEVKAIKAGFAPEFGRVSQNSDANHFIIQGSWRLRSLNNFTLLLTSIKKREEERSHHIPETLSPDERGSFVAEVQQVELGPVVAAAKELGEFRFVRIKGKWYYLPRGW